MNSEKTGVENPRDPLLAVLCQWLEDYTPATDISEQGATVLTSDDIIEQLGEIVELNPNLVAAVLVNEGCRLGRSHSGAPGWLMKRI